MSEKPADLLYQLALTMVPNIGPVQAKILLQHFDSRNIFKARQRDLERIEGIGSIRANSIKAFNDFSRAENELKFIEKYRIKTLFITEKNYPQRLLNCYDPPTLLFYKGEADLNASKTVAIVGTRNNTDYGRKITERIVESFSSGGILIISGLAFGIDSIAHRSAIANKLSTIGVVAHGLDTIYPSENNELAKKMTMQGGGILTQFPARTKPDKHNFPIRNRIVAGMADATIIVETNVRGGSMITAEMANGYNRDVFAVPGRTTDHKSSGCNYLIQTNKAVLYSDPAAFLEMMGWTTKQPTEKKYQREMFPELSQEEKIIVLILEQKDATSIDEINLKSGLSTSSVASALLSLELKGLVNGMPGKMYRLL
jgi:DNA processing protein